MTVQTNCPACGAPIEYSENQEVVVCSFCNTEIKVLEDGDSNRFQVLSQPEPQREVLSKPVEPASGGDFAGAFLSGEVPAETGGTNSEPFDLGTPGQDVFSPPIQEPVAFGNAQVYAPAAPARTSLGGLPKWAVIVIAVVAGLCLLCVCAAGASLLIFRSSTGGM